MNTIPTNCYRNVLYNTNFKNQIIVLLWGFLFVLFLCFVCLGGFFGLFVVVFVGGWVGQHLVHIYICQ